MELGRMSELEMEVYEKLADNMMEELKELPKKAPDLMVYLKGSFETVIDRIRRRGREYELDEELVEYYRFLWKDYDDWVMNHYNASQVIIIDMDKTDIVGNLKDRENMILQVEAKLKEIRAI